MSAKALIMPFIKRARKFNEKTDQKEICRLLGDVADAKIWHSSHSVLLGNLQCSLSNAYSALVNKKDGWEKQLYSDLDEITKSI